MADALIAGCWGVWGLCTALVAVHGARVAWPLAGSALAFLVALAISLSKVWDIMQKVGDRITTPYRATTPTSEQRTGTDNLSRATWQQPLE